MNYEIDREYYNLNYFPQVNDIVYMGKFYKWNEKTMKCDDWDIKKDTYKVVNIKKIYDFWVIYELENMNKDEIIINQTSYNLYEKVRFDNILNKNVNKGTIFEFI